MSKEPALLWLLLASLAAGGCAGASFKPLPEYQTQVSLPDAATGASNGSLYSNQYALLLFEDTTARRVGDVLTIRLQEKTKAAKEANTEIKKDNSNDIANPTVLGTSLEFNTPGLAPLASNEKNNPAFSTQSKHNFKGEGDSDQSNSLTGDITATVTQVLPNGNLVIRGEKFLTLNQGEERVALTGEIRPTDISPDNTVLSSRVANARIVYDGVGEVASASVMGWLSRFFISALMPF